MDLVESIVAFSCTYADLLFALFMGFFGVIIVIAVMVRVTIFWQEFRKPFKRNFVFGSVTAAIVLTCVVLTWASWDRYSRTALILSSADILPDTYWVNDDIEIYYLIENELFSIQSNGLRLKSVFKTESAIREYHFSPDGRYLLIVTFNELILYDRSTTQSEIIDQLNISYQLGSIKGSINNIAWAKNSRKFCYKIARWSDVGSTKQIMVYDVEQRRNQKVKSPFTEISKLYWDVQSMNLYYVKHQTESSLFDKSINKLKIYRISTVDFKSSFVTDVFIENTKSFEMEDLLVDDVKLYFDPRELMFDRSSTFVQSKTSKYLLIDQLDYLYLIENSGPGYWIFKAPKRKRLFKIPRLESYEYKDHEIEKLVMDQFRWLPDGRYVIIHHKQLGVLILDPFKNKIGVLTDNKGEGFGWYSSNDAY